MEKLIALGTGNANAIHCYNTCFAIRGREGLILCDAGGGNGILRQLDAAHIGLEEIHHMIVTHAHTDHLMGVVWIIRMVATRINNGQYQGQLHIWVEPEVGRGLTAMCTLMLQKKMYCHIGQDILFHDIADGTQAVLAGRKITFFDILSTKMKQFGFTAELEDGRKLCCLGDEPYNPGCEKYVQGADWLLCEAFCLYGDRERFKPYEKHHSTVKEASELAHQLHVPHLVLWHTEDKTYPHRKDLYTAEGRQYYPGDLHVPDDLEEIDLK